MARWRLNLFGGLRLEGAEATVERFETRRAALLLARLALSHQGRALRETLADELWPDDFFDATRIRLRQELSRLRKALGPAQEILWTEGEAVGLSLAEIEIDVERFAEAIRSARGLPPGPERATRLRDALRPAGSPVLPGWDEPWVIAERSRIDALRLDALGEVAEFLVEAGEPAEALTLAEQALAIDPAAERAHLAAMRAHAALGSLADALAQFGRMKRTLRERQAEPSERATELAGRIGRGEVASDAAPSVLPVPIDHLIGRGAELRSLSMALEPESVGRLLTLVGPGGMGKTRLSLEVAHTMRERYAGRVYFVPLADVSDERAIESHAVEAVGAGAYTAASPFEAVVLALGEQPSLLILDNLEHLLTPSARFVERLLRRLPKLRILTTSRQAMGIAGEREIPLAPLDQEDGVSFFVTRAQAVRPGFAVTSRNEAALRAVVDRLEGLPLALHLAASRSHLLTPEQMLHQFDSRLAFLVGRGGESERHRTMRAAIAWSHDLLDERQKSMLHKLAVFRGGWTLEAAAAVCDEPGTLDLVGELHDRSLVYAEETEDGMRYRMLETIREFGLEQLSAEELATLHRRHAEFFCDFAHRTHQKHYAGRVIWQRRIAADVDNLRDALHWTERHDRPLGMSTMAWLWHFWTVRGLLSEGRNWARTLLRGYDEFPPSPMIGTALAGAGIMAMEQGDHVDAVMWFERAREVTSQTDDISVLGFVVSNLSEPLLALGDLDGSLAAAKEGLDAWQRSGSMDLRVGLVNLAWVHIARGEFADAEPILREALELFERYNDLWGVAEVYDRLAQLHWRRGEAGEARNCLARALEVYDSIDEGARVAHIHLLWAEIEPEAAELHARTAAEIAARAGNLDRLFEAEAILCRTTGDPTAAKALLVRARGAASASAIALLEAAITEARSVSSGR